MQWSQLEHRIGLGYVTIMAGAELFDAFKTLGVGVVADGLHADGIGGGNGGQKRGGKGWITGEETFGEDGHGGDGDLGGGLAPGKLVLRNLTKEEGRGRRLLRREKQGYQGGEDGDRGGGEKYRAGGRHGWDRGGW